MRAAGLNSLKKILEGALSLSDVFTGDDSLETLRVNRVLKTLDAHTPAVVTSVSRAELSRLIWLCCEYVTQGNEETLKSIQHLGHQFHRGSIEPGNPET